MSDYNNPNDFDKYGNPIPGTSRPFVYEPAEGTGRAPYVLLGILVLLGIVGGAMYFNGGHRTASNVASAPPAITDTTTTPAPMPPSAPMTGPASTTPAPTATPAPAGPASTDKQ
jgi:hypothetical protein